MLRLIKLKEILVLVLVILVILRIVIIALSAEEQGKYFIFRHVIYTIAWISILRFAIEFTFTKSNTDEEIHTIKMKNLALLASLACLAKFGVTLAYQFPFNYTNALTLSHIFTELLAWLVLSLFFLGFWKWKKGKVK